ncbi:MAG: serine protease [Nanoarchaeota archaeon]|nr:serine protease [Nanoarchaeota archaeon]
MFANAYKLASSFTRPVIISTRFFDKTVECGCGAFIVINDEGWIITVAHLLNPQFAFQQHAKEISDYNRQLQTIQQNQRLDAKQKSEKIGRLKTNPKWITNNSFWWACDGVQLKDIKLLPEGDLVIGRLNPFDPKTINAYPVLKDSITLNIGTSLCKLGYPFHKIDAAFNEANNTFKLAPGALPLPRFPIEGIYTRNVMAGKSKDGKYDIKFLETSSPGLRGQSGGPIFDVKGTVWAIQSRTAHLPLGFSPKIKKNGQEVEENQFLNVGWGVHPELIVSFLKDNGIKFNLSDY